MLIEMKVFYKSTTCYCLVNIKPILPGHVLVIPYRMVPRMTDLSSEEVTDLFTTVQKVQRMMAGVYFTPSFSVSSPPWTKNLSSASYTKQSKEEEEQLIGKGSFNVAIQDGEEAGQTVKHMHCHIIPRIGDENDLKGDQVYDILQGEDGNVGGGFWDRESKRPVQRGKFPKIEDVHRLPRSEEDMNKEAEFYRVRMGVER